MKIAPNHKLPRAVAGSLPACQCLAVLAAAALMLGSAQGQTGVTWTLRNPLPTNENLAAAAWSGTSFAAVGNGGVIVTSPDAVTWTKRSSGIITTLNAVVWTGTQFAAVGDAGVVLTSPDGTTWTKRTTGTTKSLKAVVWTGANFAALGEDGTALTSNTGQAWTTRFTGTALDLLAAVWTGSEVIAVGEQGVTLESASGVSWAQNSLTPALNFTGVAWDGAQLIAVAAGGTTHTSPTGVTWTLRHSSGASLAAVLWTGSVAVATGSSGTILTSPDGIAWAAQTSGSQGFLIGAVQGAGTTLVVGETGVLLSSTNTTTWTNRSLVSHAALRDVAWTGLRIVATGADGAVLSSADGVAWVVETSGTANDLNAVTWIGDKLVAVGESGEVRTSPNGVTWTAQTSGVVDDLFGVAWTRDLVIAVGAGGRIITSPDGITWTVRASGTGSDLRSVVWAAGKALAVGAGGTICSSADGLIWSATTVAPFTDLQGITHAGTQFCAVGAGDTILTSPSGTAWTQRVVAFGQNLNAVAWTGSRLVAVGTSQIILNSTTGVTWTQPVSTSVNLPTLRSVEFFGTLLVAVGDGGDILTSGTSPTLTPVVNLASATQTVAESAGAVTLGLQLSFAPAVTTKIPFSLSGTMTSGLDFTTSPTMVTFSPGQSLKNITLTLKDDVLVEPSETLIVTLGSPTNSLIGTISRFTLTVTNNDIAPTIILQPVSQMVAVGTPITTCTTAATGSPPVTFKWRKNGGNITNATSTSYSILNIQLTHSGQYTAVATNPTASATSTIAEIGVVNTAAGSVQVPVSGTAHFTISATGNSLTYQWRKNGIPMSNGGRISGVTATKLTITNLVIGDSDIYTCVVTGPGGNITGGNQSLSVLLPPVMNPLALPSTMVSGSYSHTLTATQLPTKFTVTGLPKGLTCHAATGAITGRATVSGTFLVQAFASNEAGSSPTISGSLTVQSIPTGAVGSFTGMIDREFDVNDDLGGRVDFTTTSTGICTGKVILGGSSYSFTTVLDTAYAADPELAVTIPRSTLPDIEVALTLSGSFDTLSGTIGTGGPIATVTGWRRIWSSLGNPATSHAGYYSFGLDISLLDVGNPAIPQGTSYATCTVGIDGGLTITGKMADGAAFTTATFLGPDGEALLFQTLYSKTGSVLGIVSLTLDGALAFTNNTFTGSVTWQKEPQAPSQRSYQAGFGPLALSAYGRYLAPDTKGVVLGLPASTTTAQLLFAEGGVGASSIDPDVTAFTYTDTFTVILPTPGGPANPGKATLTINKATGMISGKFTLVDGSVTRTVNYEGVIIRPASGLRKAFGFFNLPQLPTPSTAPILSGQVVIQQ